MTHTGRGAHQTRIGVSIQVPQPYSSQLQEARRSFGDPQADNIPPHITLLGPTLIDAGKLPEAVLHLEGVARAAEPFQLMLRGSATFRPVSPVVFIQVVQGIAECEQLERAVRSGPLEQVLRFNYHPHVTVAHEIPDEALDRAFSQMATFEATFEAASFHMFELGDDGVWHPGREFPLGGSPAGAGSPLPSV